MPTKVLIRHSEYRDSVTLMEVARELTRLPSVSDAAVVMATAANKGVLTKAGLLLPEIEAASANDLVVVVRAETPEAADHALQAAEKHLARRPATADTGVAHRPRTIRGALHAYPEANLAVISVAGEHAAAEAWEALRRGLHVLLFSDNVPIEEEGALKQYAVEHGLLLMGAGCGTAILNGVALGFANVVPRGPVGIVAAAGTGLQEVSTLLAKRGIGITQGIGTGGRDLSEAIGGLMMREGMRLLQDDPQTEVLLLVSKPPASSVAARVLEELGASAKPAVICFLGGDPAPIAATGAIPARTLQEGAYLAAAATPNYKGPSAAVLIEQENAELRAWAGELRRRLRPRQQYLRGLFSGGTLASEALVIWEEIIGDVLSNVARDARLRLPEATRSQGHCAVDLGEEEFTVGRPHPMIDQTQRIERLFEEAAEPEVAAIVLDIVLGYGAHPDPAGELGPAIYRARARAASEGRELLVVASVTGTEEDPQKLSRQVDRLEGAGAIVAPCNAAAAKLAGMIVTHDR